ncbi:hypothetical protein [Cellulomonas endophytica]|uniref:hypothetical protein n=1 Tax=Cellulomonas endophytica TaxID=2494735 RepID=UPI00101307CA|nr:hypothetical protein [Cellulomonas endophytica]
MDEHRAPETPPDGPEGRAGGPDGPDEHDGSDETVLHAGAALLAVHGVGAGLPDGHLVRRAVVRQILALAEPRPAPSRVADLGELLVLPAGALLRHPTTGDLVEMVRRRGLVWPAVDGALLHGPSLVREDDFPMEVLHLPDVVAAPSAAVRERAEHATADALVPGDVLDPDTPVVAVTSMNEDRTQGTGLLLGTVQQVAARAARVAVQTLTGTPTTPDGRPGPVAAPPRLTRHERELDRLARDGG